MTKRDSALGTKEIVCILVNQLTVKLFIGQARMFSAWAANAAWLLYLCGFLCQIGIFLLTAAVYKKDHDRDPIDLAGDAFGRAGEILAGVLFLLYFFTSFSSLIRLYVEALKAAIFHYSPMWYILLFFLIAVGTITFFGINTSASLHVILVPIIVTVMLLNCVFSFERMEITNLFPIFGNGASELAARIPEAMGASAEMLILYFFLPHTNEEKFPKKAGMLSLLLGCGATFISVLSYVLTVVYPASKEYLLSMYQISRLSLAGKILNRAEDLFEAFWMISVILSLSVKLWLMVSVFKKMFRLPSEKPLIWPVCILGFALGFLPVSLHEASAVYEGIFIEYLRWIAALLPLLIALAAKIKNKIGGRRHARSV